MPSTQNRTGMSPATVVLTLALLLGVQPVASDLYLPALPALTAHLGATMPQAQLSLTALLLAFGCAQLVWGPLSDRYGRRPVLLAGMAAFTLASAGSVFAQTIEGLLVWRALQGAAMGAAVVCARAIVRDLFDPVEGARTMSRGLTGLGVLACVSTPLGGLLSGLWGWRAALAALAVFGAAALGYVLWRFEETLPPSTPQAQPPPPTWHVWGQILRHPTYWAYALLMVASYAGLFTFLATSSFVFIGLLGHSTTGYGLLMFTSSLTYIAGTVACRRLIPRLGVRRTVALAGGFTLAGGTLTGVLGWLGIEGTWAIMGPFYLFILAHGVHQPCGQSGAVSPFPQSAGTASAVSGFSMMAVAFGVGLWLGGRVSGTPGGSAAPLTQGLWFWSNAIALVAWTLVQRHGEPSTAVATAQGSAR